MTGVVARPKLGTRVIVPRLDLNSGLDMPAVGFGTWQLKSSQAAQAVTVALDEGYRLIDTARIYFNEQAVGKAIRQHPLKREEVFISTKLWNVSHGYHRAHIAFKKSLKRLGVDYVDFYLIHWPVSGRRLKSWQALVELYKSGQARSIGVCNYTVRHLEELMTYSDIVPSVNQVEFHPFLYKDQIELLAFCKKHGIVVEAYSPLAHGHKMNEPTLVGIAQKHKKSVPQIMLRWAIQHGTIPLPKSAHPERIKDNINVFDFSLTAREMDDINDLSEGLRTCWNPESIA